MLLSERKKFILKLLLENKRTWTELKNLLKISEKALYEHLKELRGAGYIKKDVDGKYTLTEEGFNILAEILTSENMQPLGEEVLPQEIETLEEVRRTIPPSLDFTTRVAPKGIVSNLVRIPFIQELVVRYGEEERLFYAFLSELYLECLKMYGPPGIKFSKELFYRIRRDIIKEAFPQVSEDKVENVRLKLIIEFAPSIAFDKISRRIPEQKLRQEIVERKKEILTEVLKKLYGIKIIKPTEESKKT